MATNERQPYELERTRRVRLSKGHNPPTYVDDELPTYESTLFGMGGPGKTFPRTQGTRPWLAGSMTIGSNHVLNVFAAHFNTSTPNVWFLLRHSRSGSNAANPGGTIAAWHLAARGQLDIVSEKDSPLMSIRAGTVTLYGVGGRRVATGSMPFSSLPSSGSEMVSAKLRGYVL